MEEKNIQQMEIEEMEKTGDTEIDVAEVEALVKKDKEEKKALKKVKEPKEKKEKAPKEPKEKKEKAPKEPKEKKEKEPKAPKEKKVKAPKEPKEKKPINIDPKKLVTWVGIGALCLVGIISLLSSLLPNAGVSEAILGIVCLALAVSLVMQIVMLESHTSNGGSANEEALKAQVANLEKELEVQKAIVGALFEFDDYLPKNKRFHSERKSQYEAQTTVYQIKNIIKKATEYEDLEMRGQYINEVEKALERFYENIQEE